MVFDPGIGVVQAKWDDLIGDAEAIGESLEADGWHVIVTHPGDVTARSKSEDVFGLNVVIPTSVFEEIRNLVETGTVDFDDAEVYRTGERGVVFLVISILDPDEQTAVIVPAWYGLDRGLEMLDMARAVGEMRTTIRPLDPAEDITFSHADPELFAPPHPSDNEAE